MNRAILVLYFACIAHPFFGQHLDFKTFIPSGFAILDSARWDLNEDGIADYILVLKSDMESDEDELLRPVVILHGNENGGFTQGARNDSLVLCQACGGAFGDPYAGIFIDKNQFSIAHYGGSAWRWGRSTTFRYNKQLNAYILQEDKGESFHATEPDKAEFHSYREEVWGTLEFENYSMDW